MSGEWETTTLRHLLTQVKRSVIVDDATTYSTLGIRGNGAGCFEKPGQIGSSIKTKTMFAVAEDDVVFSRLFAWRGSFAVIPKNLAHCIASNEFPTFRCSDRLLPEFFALWAQRADVRAEVDGLSTGTTTGSRNRLSVDDFLDLEITVPLIDQQRSIVAAVRRVDRASEAAHATARALDRTFQAMAVDAFESSDATIRRLGDATKVTSGGTPSRKSPANFTGAIPWVKTGEVNFRTITDTEEHISEEALSSSSAKMLPEGTVLVAMYGQGATRGRVALLGKPMATNQACAAIWPSDTFDPEYLFFALWSRYQELRENSEGSAQDNMNLSMVKDIEVPAPTIDEQREVAIRLRTLRKAVDAQQERVQRLRHLRTALIEELTSGESPVPSFAPDTVPTSVPDVGAGLEHRRLTAADWSRQIDTVKVL